MSNAIVSKVYDEDLANLFDSRIDGALPPLSVVRMKAKQYRRDLALQGIVKSHCEVLHILSNVLGFKCYSSYKLYVTGRSSVGPRMSS